MTREQAVIWANALDVYAPESRACMAAALERCLADGTASDEEVQTIIGRGHRGGAPTCRAMPPLVVGVTTLARDGDEVSLGLGGDNSSPDCCVNNNY